MAGSALQHESGLGRLELVSRAVQPALRRHVLRYQGFHERTPRPLRRREPPQAGATVILAFGPRLRLPEAGLSVGSFAAGPDDAFTLTEHDGTSHGIQVDLTPFGAGLLLGLPPGELARAVVPLEDALRDGGLLVERLAEAPGWDARFDLLDEAIGARLADRASAPLEVEWAWRRLVSSGGRARVGDLAAEIGWSRRHFGARFREHVGLPPKLVARIARFRRALALLQGPGSPALAEVAHACGYADQAHLSRDVRAFAGATPSELVARLLPDGLGVGAEEVANVQDASGAGA
jgi:AraC-like DNA-binding protein